MLSGVWDEPMTNQPHRGLIAAVFLLILFHNAYCDSIGINETKTTWILYNDYHPFYIDKATGIQYTNDPLGYWSLNAFCWDSTKIGEKCINNFTGLTWISKTDNKTYAYLKGTASYTSLSKDKVDVIVEYLLVHNDSRIKVTVNPTSNFSDNGRIIWRTHQIQVNRTPEGDIGLVDGVEFLLNETKERTYNNVTSFLIYEPDEVEGYYWMQTDWEGSKTLYVKRSKSEYNAYFDLTDSFTSISSSINKTMTIWWEDAKCLWTCQNDGLDTYQIYQNEQFYHYLTYQVSTPLSCPLTATVWQQHYNSSDWVNTGQGGSKIDLCGGETPETNPHFVRSNRQTDFCLTGSTVGNWTVRGSCIASGTKTSSTSVIEVLELPVGYCATQLTANTTFTENYEGCYNVSNKDNLYIDCDDYNWTGDNTNFALYIFNSTNIEVRNCNFRQHVTTVNASYSANLSFINDTIQDNENAISGVQTYGFRMDMVNNTYLQNIGIRNVTDADDIEYSAYFENSDGVEIYNMSMNESNYGIRIQGDSTWTRMQDMDFNDTNYPVYVYASVGDTCEGNNTIMNITVNNCSYGIYFYGCAGEVDNATINDAYYRGIYVNGDGASWSNATNIYVSNSASGVGVGDNVVNTRFENVTIINATSGLYIYQTNYVTFENAVVNHTDKCILNKGEGSYPGSYFNFIVCDDANVSYDAGDGYDYGSVVGNSTFYPANELDIEITLGYDIKFQNTTTNYSNMFIYPNYGNMSAWWYGRINVTNSSGDLLTSTINISDVNNTLVHQVDADLTDWLLLRQINYYSTGANVSFNLHNISVNRTGYLINSTTYNISQRDHTVNLTLYEIPDTTPPYIVFVDPTHLNETVEYNYSFVNVTVNEPASNCNLSWNSTWIEMTDANSSNWYYNNTNLGNGNYTFFVNCTDLSDNTNITGTRWVYINFTPADVTLPYLEFVPPTPPNDNTTNVTWVFLNITSNEPLVSAMVNWNGTWYSLNSLNSTSWYRNMTSLGNGTYWYNVSGNDTSYNLNYTETRNVTVAYSAPITATNTSLAISSLLVVMGVMFVLYYIMSFIRQDMAAFRFMFGAGASIYALMTLLVSSMLLKLEGGNYENISQVIDGLYYALFWVFFVLMAYVFYLGAQNIYKELKDKRVIR